MYAIRSYYAFIRLMGTPEETTGPVNLGNPVEFTIRELAELVLEMTGSKSKLVWKELPSDDPKQRQPNIGKARELLKWEPAIPLQEGLHRITSYNVCYTKLLRVSIPWRSRCIAPSG